MNFESFSFFLSKTSFLRGLRCYKSLYLSKYYPELKTPASDAQDARFETGRQVNYFAYKLFPCGVEIPYKDLSWREQIEATEFQIKNGVKILYEGAFFYSGIFARVDILKMGEHGWEMYEVKSSTSVREIDIYDASLQYYVLKGTGVPVSNAYIIHINNEYVREGEIDPWGLFAIEDVTESVEEKQKFIRDEIEKQTQILSGDMPNIDIGEYCIYPYECDFKEYCWRDIPQHSIFTIRGKGFNKFELYREGIVYLKDVPYDLLSDYQKIQFEGHIEKKNFVNRENLKRFLDTLWYPMYFLDFETFEMAIPPFDGTKPYQKIPFQYSLHLLESEDAELKHFEYLARPNTDPRYEMIQKLLEEISPSACILVYNSLFEKSILENFAFWFPHLKDRIENISNNIIDLMAPFKERDVYFFNMQGSYSMKAVLPALVPELTYKNMEIKDGGEASRTYLKMCEMSDPDEIQKIRQALLEYCKLDSFGMVKILERLKEL